MTNDFSSLQELGNSNSACLPFCLSPFSPITSARHRHSTEPLPAVISMPFWQKLPSSGWLPQPDGIRHRNSECGY
jgi:hypothetical protein